MTKPRLCLFDPCARMAHARGMCMSHYGQWSAGKELAPIRARRTPTGDKRTKRDVFLWVHYKMTLAEYEVLATKGCHFCGSLDDLVVDHDHLCCPGKRSCGSCVRGVLCRTHNVWLGMAGDDPDFLERALVYLQGVFHHG